MSDEKRLIKFLLGNYAEVGVVGRPVLNHSETIKVYYGLSLVQILDLDEKNQVLQTNVWSRYVSTDWFSGETSYRLAGGETICPRRWQFDSRRIYVRPRTCPQSAHG